MRKNKLLLFIGLLSILFLLMPLLMIAITAFGSAPIIQFPIQGFTFKWFSKVLASKSLITSLYTSLRLALIASVLGILIALPTSYALSKRKDKLSKTLLSYFLSPSLIPGVVMGYALFKTLTLTFRLTVMSSLILGHLLIVLPYAIRLIAAQLNDFDESIEEAAKTLGAKPLKAYILVVLPSLKGALLAAFMMSFINSFNNLPVSLFLKGPGINTLPAALMSHMEYNFDPSVSALSLMLMIGTLLMMVMMEWVTRRKESMK